jgi:hypothetical protein
MVNIGLQKVDMPGFATNTMVSMHAQVVNFQLLVSAVEGSHAILNKVATGFENKRDVAAKTRSEPKS